MFYSETKDRLERLERLVGDLAGDVANRISQVDKKIEHLEYCEEKNQALRKLLNFSQSISGSLTWIKLGEKIYMLIKREPSEEISEIRIRPPKKAKK